MDFSKGYRKIFFILGDDCNMQCAYCKAHLKANTDKVIHKVDVTQEVLDFLAKEIKQQPTLINFYGGEPFLYFDTMKYVVDTLNIPKGEVLWSTMTNGRALTKEIVDFVNEKEMVVNLSWDGRVVEQTRGFDVLKDNKLRECIMSINNLFINATLTALTSPKEILDSFIPYTKEYQQKNGKPLKIHIGLATPHERSDKLYDYDYIKIYNEICDILWQGTVVETDYESSPYSAWAKTMMAKVIAKQEKKRELGVCLDMDTKGNFFMCPFSCRAVDTLATYDSYLEKAKRRLEIARCKEDCPVQSICDGGCAQLKGTPAFEDGCKLRLVFYLPLVQLITGQLAARYERSKNTEGGL